MLYLVLQYVENKAFIVICVYLRVCVICIFCCQGCHCSRGSKSTLRTLIIFPIYNSFSWGMQCREKVSFIDIKALVAFLETNEDKVCIKDVLFMILGMLTQKTFVLSFIEHLNALGGITILLNLMRRSTINSYSLRMSQLLGLIYAG